VGVQCTVEDTVGAIGVVGCTVLLSGAGRCGSDRSILTLHATSALPGANGCVPFGESHRGADLTSFDAPVA